MITPRQTRLVRVSDLHAFRRAILSLSNPEPSTKNPEPEIRNPEPIVLVPTRSAARQLELTFVGADRRLGRGADTHVLPCPMTRDELYEHLRTKLSNPPRWLMAIERDVIAQAAALATASSGIEISFELRPGLVAEMLRFYDQLRRQSQQVSRFEALIEGALDGADAEVDRGVWRMRQQTRFLAATFREYERRVRESGSCDEHLLREQLIRQPLADPIRRIIVTVADWIADDNGLYVADFDLLSRIPNLESIDIVCTEGVLRSGFHERLHGWLPGIADVSEFGIRDSRFAKPVVVVPPSDISTKPTNPESQIPNPERSERPANPESQIPNPEHPWWTHRDREEELVTVVRMIKANRRRGEAVPLSRTAVVYKRPLPYLYLAAEVFGAANIPYQTADALPLASQPTAAAFDLVLEAVVSDFTRDALVSLLRSPHLVFFDEGREVTREMTSALNRALSDARYLGGLEKLEGLEGADSREGRKGQDGRDWSARAARRAVVAAARELAPLASPRPASQQVRLLLDFWASHVRPLADEDPFASNEHRARAAIVEALTALAGAHASQDEPSWTIENLRVAVRRIVEEQTFSVDAPSAHEAVQFLDDQAARYGDFDDLTIVGVVENEWPEKPRRNIFYPPGILKSLGWPTEKDRRAAADARFLELLASPARRTVVSTFTLDDDALVMRSMQLDEIRRAGLSPVAAGSIDYARIFLDEALSQEPPTLAPFDGVTHEWASRRVAGASLDAPSFHGSIGRQPARAWSVSALETYLGCPFRFFAQHVLALDEDPDDEEVMDPRRQGQFIHEVFAQFFKAWQDAGHRAIDAGRLEEARLLFADVVERLLAPLSPAEAGLERTRLLGSSAAAGLGEAVFRMEAERPIAVVERLLEHRLEGEFTIATSNGPRTIALKGKADRLDLLEDGTFRLIDYKLGWPPDRARALQLSIYGVCAEQRLGSHRGRRWTLGEAAYLAFKGPRRVVPLFPTPAKRDEVLAAAQQRLADTIDRIALGEFPPTPDDVFRCETCTFASVCRKDYVGEV